MNDLPEGELNQPSTPLISPPARPPVIVIAGPTAVGKTELAIWLSLQFGGEVVNADSRYLYRGFTIGVAKPSPFERQGVPHHLIDILDPWEEMTLALFQQRALESIGSVQSRGHLPILTGGTPLYINAVVEGWRIPQVPPDHDFRRRLTAEIESSGLEAVAARLAVVDPVTAARSGQNARRVIRALEIYNATGQPMSELEGKTPPPFRTLQIGLTMPREQLFASIDARVDNQIAVGLVDEARSLLEAGIDANSPAFSSIGYRQLLPYFAGESTLDDAIVRIKFDTHRYVRHQETWLRRNRELIRIDVTSRDWQDRAASLVGTFLNNDQDGSSN